MAKRFVFLNSVKKNYQQQGKIFFECLGYNCATKPMKEKIDKLCQSVGGQHAKALKEFLTTDADMQYISTKYYVSTPTLDRLRKAFYEKW